MNKSSDILNHWNSFGSNGRWRTHRRVTPDIEKIISTHLKRWTAKDICEAITNFAKIVQGGDYKWTYYKWGLYEFLSRRDKMNTSEYQWRRFHPNNFVEDDWLTDTAREIRRTQAKVESAKNPYDLKPLKAVPAPKPKKIFTRAEIAKIER